MFNRNLGFFSEEEQAALTDSVVAIAGVGGDGFQLAYKLAMMGVGTIKVADPEVFEIENANRVFGATSNHIGKNKAAVFKLMAEKLPSKPKVIAYTEGVTESNIADFIKGADLIIDESELTYLHIGTMIARHARKAKVPVLMVMNIGFAGVVTSFKPAGKTFEQMMGIPEDATLKQIAKMKIELGNFIPYLPPYGDLKVLKEVQNGASLPSISQGVDVASALGTTEAFLHLTSHMKNHRRLPVWAPEFRYIDAYTNKSAHIKFPSLSYKIKLFRMAAGSILNKNPHASYHQSSKNK